MSDLRTLVLNKNYMPVSHSPLSTISAPEAMKRIFAGTCESVLDYDRQILTQNPNALFFWPSIIIRKGRVVNNTTVKLTTENLFYRDEGKCQYCSKELNFATVTFDHVWPQSLGGEFTWDNIVSCCGSCNMRKADKKPEGEWKPKILPKKPSYFELVAKRKKFPLLIDDPRWMDFVGDWEGPVNIRYP